MTKRSFGTEISGNRRKSHESSNVVRGLILNDLDGRQKSKMQIAAKYQVSRGAVRSTLQRWEKQHTLDSLPRKGRPGFLSPRTRKYLFRLIRRNPHMAIKAIPFELQRTFSRTTIWRALSGLNIRKWHTKRKDPVDEKGCQAAGSICRFSVAQLGRKSSPKIANG